MIICLACMVGVGRIMALRTRRRPSTAPSICAPRPARRGRRESLRNIADSYFSVERGESLQHVADLHFKVADLHLRAKARPPMETPFPRGLAFELHGSEKTCCRFNVEIRKHVVASTLKEKHSYERRESSQNEIYERRESSRESSQHVVLTLK